MHYLINVDNQRSFPSMCILTKKVPMAAQQFAIILQLNEKKNSRSLSGFLQHEAAGSNSTSPGQDASPSQVTPPAQFCQVSPTVRRYPFIYLGGERHCESKVSSKNTTQCPRPGLEPGPLAPESSALTMRPPRLPQLNVK